MSVVAESEQSEGPELKLQNAVLSVDDYDHLTHREHVLKKPDTYVGSCTVNQREEWIYDLNTQKMALSVVELPEAMSRLFLEILTNSIDSIGHIKMTGTAAAVALVKPIEVTMTAKSIQVKNYCDKTPIPVMLNESKMYIPEMLFSVLLTSSNYDQTKIRFGCGTNGYGAKLANVYSTNFYLEVKDELRKKLYKQTFENNMTVINPPEITPDTTPGSYVIVRYTLDFKWFLTKKLKQAYYSYPPEAYHLFAGYCVCMSLGPKVPIVFNGVTLDCTTIQKTAKLCFGAAVKPELEGVEEEVEEESELVGLYEERQMLIPPKGMTKKSLKEFPEVELLLFDTPWDGKFISIVNGIMTKDGGVHVNEVYKVLSAGILKSFDTKSTRITVADIKQHVSVIINCRLQNPKFGGQTKQALTEPTPTIAISDKTFSQMKTWQLWQTLENIVLAKQSAVLVKTDGQKKKNVKLKKNAVEANLRAHKTEFAKCCLLVVEGASAAGYANQFICNTPNGRDYLGLFPLKGKIMNIRGRSDDRIAANEEIEYLKIMLGLKEGLDYSDPEVFNSTLRYGSVYAMVDADDDGKHILGLLYDLFEVKYPTLLKMEFIKFYRTCLVSVTKSKVRTKFYSESEFTTWQAKGLKGYAIKYYKGLGSSENFEVKEDAKAPRIVRTIYDSEASNSMSLAFDKTKANDRKDWIEAYDSNNANSIESLPEFTLSDFVNNELIKYCIANIERSIPRLSDGLKPVQRKILWTLLKEWNGYSKNFTPVKVAALQGSTNTFTHYHHGDNSIGNTIVTMTQEFVGANNLPLFHNGGQFGTRIQGGKDASQTRYVAVTPEWWVRYVYMESDIAILVQQEDEGHKIEPETFLPIIPMCLVNGACGIATGYSTFIPCHNPLDMCRWIRNRIAGKKSNKISPWYRGFEGTIEFSTGKRKVTKKEPELVAAVKSTNSPKRKSPKGKVEEEELEEGEEPAETESTPFLPEAYEVPPENCVSMLVKGKFTGPTKGSDRIKITELPIGVWTNDYISWLNESVKDKVLTEFKQITTPANKVELELTKFKDPSLESLRLLKYYQLGNMTLLDAGKKPLKFKTCESILEAFYEYRLPYYEVRRQSLIAGLSHAIESLGHKIKFIFLMLNNKINVKHSKEDNYKVLDSNEVPRELLTRTTVGSCCKEDQEELQKEMESLQGQLVALEAKTGENLWEEDLESFSKEYKRRNWNVYPED